MAKLTHVDDAGKAKMVDVGGKKEQNRIAKASGFIKMSDKAIALIKENSNKKGDVLRIAEIAGIQGGKKTSELIPLCHPLLINKIDISANLHKDGVELFSEVACNGKTGVEMEAITAVSIGLITMYDMCKAVDKDMVISDIKLLEKVKK